MGGNNTSNYREHGGAREVIGGELDVVTGGEIDVEDGGLLKFKGAAPATDFTMAAAAGAANVTEVTITAKDNAGNTIAAVHQFDLWLSDDDDGEGHTGTTASGTVTAKSASGAVVDTQVSKKALRVQTLKTGVFVLEITDTAKTAFKVAAQAPGNGRTVVGITLASGDYGS